MILNFLTVLLTVQICYSQDQIITESQVLNSTLKNFPLILESEMKFLAADSELESNRGAFDHKLKFKTRNKIEDIYNNQYLETFIERQTPYYGIGLIAGHRQGSGKFAEYDGFYRTSTAGEIFGGLTIPLLRNFALDQQRLDLKIGHLEKAIAEYELHSKRLITVHKALSSYYKWILATKKLQIRKNILKLAKDRHEMILKRVKAGDLERLKLKDNQRTIDKRMDDVLKSEIELKEAINKLSLFLRDDKGVSIIVQETQIPQEPLIHKQIVNREINLNELPQIQILNAQLSMMKEQNKFYQSQKLPGLNFDVLGSKELSSNVPYDSSAMKVGVMFDFPLENRKAEGKSVATEYKQRALEKQKDYISQEFDRNYDYSIFGMKESLTRLEIVSREHENSVVMAEAERKKWLQGDSDLFIFNLREQDVAEAEIKKWSTLLESQQFYVDALLFSGTLINSL
jgi:outer membrane protein TolC